MHLGLSGVVWRFGLRAVRRFDLRFFEKPTDQSSSIFAILCDTALSRTRMGHLPPYMSPSHHIVDSSRLERAGSAVSLGLPLSTRSRGYRAASTSRKSVLVYARQGFTRCRPNCERSDRQGTTAKQGPVTTRSAGPGISAVVRRPLRHYCRSRAPCNQPDDLIQLRQVVRVWFRKAERPACIAVPSLRALSLARPQSTLLAHIYICHDAGRDRIQWGRGLGCHV